MGIVSMPKPDQGVIGRRDQIVRDLQALVKSQVISAEDERRAFETDALTAYKGMPLCVVLPESTQEVSAVLAYCNQNNIKVVPRGAGTSLTGGALPTEDAVLIGVSRLNKVLDISYENRTMRVESGITNLGISNEVAHEGFFYAPDPSSQIACTLAGNIAMNSGGAHCLKYGVTTNNVLGANVVLIDGTIIEVGSEASDGAGYDLMGVICGSEGQLGIVTEATVRILPKREGAKPMLLGFDRAEDAGACVGAILEKGVIPVAIEYMDGNIIKVCEDYAHAGYPDVEAILIVEVEGSETERDEMLDKIIELAKLHNVVEVKVSRSEAESAAIWKGRKAAFGAVGRISDYFCMDGVIPLQQLPYVLKRTAEITESYGLKVANVFHAGDGNLHPLIQFDMNDEASLIAAENCGADILKLCVEVGGCLTGEHGVGIEKRDLMHVQFHPHEMAQQKRIKTALDPQWLLNPAKVFPLEDASQTVAKPAA